MVKCGGNQLNAELKGRWDAGQISRLLKSHRVPSSDLILSFNYGNSVYLLWLLSYTPLSDSLSGSLVLTVSLSLPLQPSAVQHSSLFPTAANSFKLPQDSLYLQMLLCSLVFLHTYVVLFLIRPFFPPPPPPCTLSPFFNLSILPF